jgi:lipopolysaccharide/colanic/teichoic acid biosynthesis glycosyltransferase
MSAVKKNWKARAPKRACIRDENPSSAVSEPPQIHPHTVRTIRCDPPAWKHILDLLYILITLPVTIPLMVALAMWIKIISRGPLLFRQRRVGLHGKRFTLYKFRSMKMDASGEHHKNYFHNLVKSNQPMVKLDLLCDPRLLPGGCLVRAAGLDELPQLFNILRGEMSLVGPRPCIVEELRYFRSNQRVRFSVLPGMTGIWQVHGKNSATFNEMNAMDAFYIEQMSPTLDLNLILRTPRILLSQICQALYNHRLAAGEEEFAPTESPSISGDTIQ